MLNFFTCHHVAMLNYFTHFFTLLQLHTIPHYTFFFNSRVWFILHYRLLRGVYRRCNLNGASTHREPGMFRRNKAIRKKKIFVIKLFFPTTTSRCWPHRMSRLIQAILSQKSPATLRHRVTANSITYEYIRDKTKANPTLRHRGWWSSIFIFSQLKKNKASPAIEFNCILEFCILFLCSISFDFISFPRKKLSVSK